MADTPLTYEVEIRFCVADAEQAFALLPFLQASLGAEKAWDTDILGRPIYEAGELLRVGRVPAAGTTHYYLGYKGADEGTFANIRQEWGEEITNGVEQSTILAKVGIAESFATPAAVLEKLNVLGHGPFMTFQGVDRLGYDAHFDVQTKLMRCPKILGEQVMVELEQGAASYAEALVAEENLRQIAAKFGLTERLIREEPPTLLYRVTFPENRG
ncbi:MAG: hypothetical protein R2932_40060 [Caldilineaceae bacterium]